MTMTRRTITKAAWTTPVVLAATTAPAFAASLRKDPGINGWVTVDYGTSNNHDARFDSTPGGVGPDGAPFGLYLYDINRVGSTVTDTVTNAALTLWLRGTVDSWDENSGHSNRWSNPVSIGQQVKPDGLTYRGYRFDYNGAVPGNGFTLVPAEERLYLEDFHVTAESVNSSDATFWVERRVTVNGVVQSFQRRNGERGPLGNGFPSSGRMTAGASRLAVL